MIALLLLLEATSLLARPIHLEEAAPPLVSARHVLVRFDGVEGAKTPRSHDEALRIARDIVGHARAGQDFETLAERWSETPDAKTGAMLGTFVSGVLAPSFDAFLFAAHEGDVSEPIETPSGIHVLQRIETYAAVARILVSSERADSAERAKTLGEKLQKGADFAELARALSDDKESAARGGKFAIYERGTSDVLLKAAAFRAHIGEVIGPIATPPLGVNFLKRLPLDEIDAQFRENNMVRVRSILVQHDLANGSNQVTAPGMAKAKGIADGLYARLEKGEDFKALAHEFDDDHGGRARDGDLGWIHRGTPGLLDPLQKAFLLKVGEVLPPQPTPVGFVMLRRER